MRIFRRKISEDAPTNNAGSGNIAGIGVGPNGEPGVHPRRQPKKNRTPNPKSILMAMVRRAPVKGIVESCRASDFAGGAVFSVSPSLFYEIKMAKRKGKHWRTFLNEDDCYREIREYASRNKGKILIQNESTGEMMVVRYS
jgi:hypothetical protein